MLEIILTLFIALLVYGAYAVWYKPYKLMKSYAKLLQGLGYKVLVKPYNPLENQMMATIKKGIQEGDAMKFYKEEYGKYDAIVTNILIKPKLEFVHPDFAKDFYSVDKHYQYHKQEKIVNIFSRAAGHGLPFSEGKNWKRKRTIFNKIFNFDFLKSQTEKISEACDDAISEIENQSKINQDNSVSYNILDLTVRMFSRVMMASFLGGKKDEKIDGVDAGQFLKKLISDISLQSFQTINFLLGTKFLSLGLTKEHRQLQNRVITYKKWGHQFIKKRINQIKENIKKNPSKKIPDDIIEALVMDAQNNQLRENSHEEFITNEEEIFEEFNAFFIAGTDTTSNYTQMMIYEIARYPEIEEKVREQIQKYMSNDDYSFQNLKNLKYIQLLQKETTRFHGPGTHLFSRYAKVDNYLNGLPIKKGTSVNIMSFCNHFSEKYFKNPNQFRPERWESQCENIPPFVIGGFSGGARTCIGKHLAMLQSKIGVIKFMKRYKKINLQKNDFKMIFKFLYGPEDFKSRMIVNSQKND